MISCKEATIFITKKEEGKLSLGQRIQLWQHLLICSLCRLFNLQNKTITNNAVALANTEIILSVEEKQTMVETIDKNK